MTISEAQRDVRSAFMGGFAGQLVSGCVWAASAALATWHSIKAGIVIAIAGGFCIFPLTQLLLRAMRRPGSLPKGHPMNALGMQVAFTLPLNLPLVFAATLHHLNWFYPALMIALGTHYLPFIFLYGMLEFGALAAILITGGLLGGMYLSASFVAGGWFTAVTLLVFAFLLRASAATTEKTGSAE